MNRSDAISRIRRGLGFLGADELESEIVSALLEAQRRLENGRTLPHFLKVEDEAFVVPVGSDEVALPAGFLKEVDGEGLHYVGDDNEFVFLEKLDLKNLKMAFPETESGLPSAYAVRKETVAFAPQTRDEEKTLYWSYYKRSVSLSAETSANEWLDEENGNPEALIGMAGMIIAADLRDASSLQIFQAMHGDAWRGMLAQGIEREEANNPQAIGGRL